MEKIAYFRMDEYQFTCNMYIDGRIDSSVSLPKKDWWDIPNLLIGLQDHNYKIQFSRPCSDSLDKV